MAYLDHAATTAMRPSALTTLTESAAELGNPSSLHSAGRRSRRIVEESREIFADELGVRPSDVVFTSGGTEADNLAIKGLYWAAVAKDPARTTLLVSTIEHHAVLDAVEWLAEHEGACVEWIPAGLDGRVDVEWLAEFLRRDASGVALCAVMWANNETGVIQPVESVAALCDEFEIPFHCDAVQGVAWLSQPSVGRS
ncbi:MAG TPA: cysteine desulfurase NifS, partial [Actinobacteria bacterium]|nr:cysteine desulfurase NifS [Actinomycetota bacterium]